MIYSVENFRKNISDVLGRVRYQDEDVTITRHGKPCAVVVSMVRYEELCMIEDEMDIQAAEIALQEPGAMPLDEALAEINAEENQKAA